MTAIRTRTQQGTSIEQVIACVNVPRLDTPELAFDCCKALSAEVTSQLRRSGLTARWMYMVGSPATPDLPADSPWHEVEPADRVHYVTRVDDLLLGDSGGPVYLDWTSRQFDPAADLPTVWRDSDPRQAWGTATDSTVLLARELADNPVEWSM